jgi:hypothetical protein
MNFTAGSPPETVGRRIEASYEDAGDRPTVGPNFLPVISERFARQQLWALAQVTGTVEKPLPEDRGVFGRVASGRSRSIRWWSGRWRRSVWT